MTRMEGPAEGPAAPHARRHWTLFACLAAGLAALDLLSKAWIFKLLDVKWGEKVIDGVPRMVVVDQEPVEIIPGFFELEANVNYGAFSGWFANHTGVLTALSLVALVVIAWFFRSYLRGPGPHRLWVTAGMALLWAGTLGNLYDRLVHGHVRDFIKWFVVWDGKAFIWPNFNLADSAICVGVGIILLLFPRSSGERQPKAALDEKSGKPLVPKERGLVPFVLVCLTLGGCVVGSGPPRDYLDLWERAIGQIENEDYAGARSTIQELLKRYPDQEMTGEAELLLSDLELQLGNPDGARSVRERVASEGKSPEVRIYALSGLGLREIEQEKFDSAATRFQTAAKLEQDPARRAVHLSRAGIALQRAGRFAEAEDLYQAAMALAPGSKTAIRCREQLLYPRHFSVQTGAFQEASNAERQRELLVGKGFAAEVVAVDAPAGRLHCVRVGRFPDRAPASTLRDRLLAARVLPAGTKIAVKP